MKRALIIKIGAIGDAVMALPLLPALKAQGFDQITWVSGKDIVQVLSLVPEISNNIVIDERTLFGSNKFKAVIQVLKTWWSMRKVSADVVFLLHADSRYKLLIPPWLISAERRLVRARTQRHHSFDYERLAFPEAEDRELGVTPYTYRGRPNIVRE
ncbi:MAG: hypothetical protein EOP06_09745, partial [Proteobacteria bacterium]